MNETDNFQTDYFVVHGDLANAAFNSNITPRGFKDKQAGIVLRIYIE